MYQAQFLVVRKMGEDTSRLPTANSICNKSRKMNCGKLLGWREAQAGPTRVLGLALKRGASCGTFSAIMMVVARTRVPIYSAPCYPVPISYLVECP